MFLFLSYRRESYRVISMNSQHQFSIIRISPELKPRKEVRKQCTKHEINNKAKLHSHQPLTPPLHFKFIVKYFARSQNTLFDKCSLALHHFAFVILNAPVVVVSSENLRSTTCTAAVLYLCTTCKRT